MGGVANVGVEGMDRVDGVRWWCLGPLRGGIGCREERGCKRVMV